MAETSQTQNLFWISELNRRPEVRKDFASRQAVKFYDTTLRDGEQSVGVVLTPVQKLEIARGLDELGVGRIEAGFPRVSADDAEAFKLIEGRMQSRSLGLWPGLKGGHRRSAAARISAGGN